MLATVETCKFCSSIGALSNPSKRTNSSAKRSLSYRFIVSFFAVSQVWICSNLQRTEKPSMFIQHVHVYIKKNIHEMPSKSYQREIKVPVCNVTVRNHGVNKKHMISRRKTWQKQWVPNTSDLRTSPQDWSRTNWRLRLLTCLCEGASEEASSQKMWSFHQLYCMKMRKKQFRDPFSFKSEYRNSECKTPWHAL